MRLANFIVLTVVVALAIPATVLALDARNSINDECQDDWVRDHRDGTGVISMGYPQLNSPQGVLWAAEPPVGWPGGTWEIQIGDAYDTPTSGAGMLGCYICPYLNTMVDWSGFSQFSLDVTNTSPGAFETQIIINTGATGLGEPDNLYESPWTVVAPAATVTLMLDLTSVANLNHVSNISFKLRTDEPFVELVVEAGPGTVPAIPATWGRVKATY